MGISLNPSLSIIRYGVKLGDTLVLGRQWMNVRPEEKNAVQQAAHRAGRHLPDSVFNQKWADRFFYALGATKLDFIDYSAYEGANIIWDLNEPIPDHLLTPYDTVIDGGTLEHVFACNVGLANAVRFVKPGGRYIGCSPGNNWLGHGFYQFSPEFFWTGLRALGMEIEEVSLMVRDQSGKRYSLPDPVGEKRRYEMNTPPKHIDIFCSAIKTSESLPKESPQQSDYVTVWDG